MKIKIICIALCVVFFAAGIIIAISYRTGLKSADLSDEALADFEISIMRQDVLDDLENIPTADGIIEASDAIFLVEATGNRTLSKSDILSEVVIKKVFKQYENFKENDIIYIFEPIYVNIAENPVYNRIRLNALHNIMQKNQTYIVCLKFFKRPDGYNYSDKELRIFLYTDKNFGIFSSDEPECKLMDDQTKYKYKDLQTCECLISNEEIFSYYLEVRKNLLTKLDY